MLTLAASFAVMPAWATEIEDATLAAVEPPVEETIEEPAEEPVADYETLINNINTAVDAYVARNTSNKEKNEPRMVQNRSRAGRL